MKRGPPEEEMATHSSILAVRPHEQYGKAKRYDTMTPGDRPTNSQGVQYATGEEQRSIPRHLFFFIFKKIFSAVK